MPYTLIIPFFVMVNLLDDTHIVSSSASLPLAVHSNFEDALSSLYKSIDFADMEKPDIELFLKGVGGLDELHRLKMVNNTEIITLIDLRKSGNEKRLWVIDLKNKKGLFHTLVAHGRNSGDLYATKFSNKPNSHQSSLGFYLTGNTYIGKHGLSLKLEGLEKGINDQAKARAIVVHGAAYVSDGYIKKIGRLGRSFGCPAIPLEVHENLINLIAGGSGLFIYYPDKEYLQTSHYLYDNGTLATIASGSQ